MQRLCALLLISCLNASLMLPLWLSEAASQVPECCRRTGRHKCAMQMAASRANVSTTDPSEPDIAARCPFANATHAEAVIPSSWLPAPAQVYFGVLLSHAAAQAQTEARFRCSFLRACQKRGPPAFLS